MATTPTDAINRINAANGNAYDVTNNPGGLAQGGHRQNFVPDLQASVSVAQWSADSATEAAASAVSTAADRVQTGQDRTSASNSATAAVQSATNAAGSATAAAAIYDNFDDRYLGAKSTAPTKDNDGDNLIVGALYFSTSLGAMQVWNGNAWQAQVPAAADYVLKARQISAGTGLTGGGDLTADRSFALDIPLQAEAEAGTNNAKPMTPLRVKQAVAAQSPVPGLVFISAQTVASTVAAVDFTGLTNAYDEYVVHFENVLPSVNSAQLNLRTSSDNGATYASGSSDYGYGYREDGSGSSGGSGGGTAVDFARVCGSQYGIANTPSLGGASGEIVVFRPHGTAEVKQLKSHYLYAAASLGGGAMSIGSTASSRNSTAAINAIRFLFSNGTITSGSFKLYGRRKV